VSIYYSSRSTNRKQFFFLINLWASSLQQIIEEQYILARKINISPDVSNMLPDFERTIYVSLLVKELEEEHKRMKQARS